MIEEYLKPLKNQLEDLRNFRFDEKNCKVWVGSRINDYGRIAFRVDGEYKDFYVHRLVICLKENVSYYSDFFVCHVCNNRSCFNQEHLYIGDYNTNARDKAKTITHCPQGHEYTPQNTYKEPRGDSFVRVCRACLKIKRSKYTRTPEQRRVDSKKYYDKIREENREAAKSWLRMIVEKAKEIDDAKH